MFYVVVLFDLWGWFWVFEIGVVVIDLLGCLCKCF